MMYTQKFYLETNKREIAQLLIMSSPNAPESSNNSRHEHDDEIPTEQNIEQTHKTIEKQDKVPGKKRDKVITD